VFRGKRGSAMVEAAIFFPITIFAVMAVFTLLLNLYSQTALQAHMHLYVRAEAAAVGDRVNVRIGDAYVRDRYRQEAESVSFALETEKSDGRVPYYWGERTDLRGFEREFFGRWYVIDEAVYHYL
jgi:hypothetical protein